MSQRVGVKPPNNRLATGGTRKKMKTPGGRFAPGVSSKGQCMVIRPVLVQGGSAYLYLTNEQSVR
jgi:hypothetical protein